MSLTFIRSAAGAALLAVLAAGCGTAVTAQHAGAQPHHSASAHAPVTTPASPPATTAPAPATTPASPPATTAPAPATTAPANPIPQGNGGDHDPDNNGGPSDGDGNL
jgi:hypothetical protein